MLPSAFGDLPTWKRQALPAVPGGAQVAGWPKNVTVSNADCVVSFSRATDNLSLQCPSPQVLISQGCGCLSSGSAQPMVLWGKAGHVGAHRVLSCPDSPAVASLAPCPLSNLVGGQLHRSCLRRPDAFVEGAGCTQSQEAFSEFFM